MKWEEYEDITKQIYETLGKNTGVKIECHGRKCKVKGKSGVIHQIDVLTSHSDGVHNYKTAIECKHWDKKINKDIIMKLLNIIDDANINKGILVSTKGFTKSALTYAKHKDIGLVELREITDKDWEGRIKYITFNLKFLYPKITKCEPILSKGQLGLEGVKTRSDYLDIIKIDGDREKFEKYAQIFADELAGKNEGEQFEKTFDFDEGTKLHNTSTDQFYLIKGITFIGILTIIDNKVEVDGEDHIWLIMKSIFEGKEHVISKDGRITEMDAIST